VNKPILTVMPDYGSGPYLWILRDSTPDCTKVGGNIASYEFWPDYDFLSSVSKELQEDFDDWVLQFELYAELKLFRWDTFHKRGLTLARRLKKQLGNKAIVRYVKPCEDPNHEQEETTLIE
jgi:hypothetical protein